MLFSDNTEIIGRGPIFKQSSCRGVIVQKRLKTTALEDLMYFLAFLVPKLWPKYHKLIREIPANPLENS